MQLRADGLLACFSSARPPANIVFHREIVNIRQRSERVPIMKVLFASIFSATLLLTSVGFAQTSGKNSSSAEEKIRSKVQKYAESEKKVVVTTTFGDRSKGRIVRFDTSGFILKDLKTGAENTFQYGKISKVEKIGGLSTASIVTLAAVGAGAAIIIGFIGVRCRNEGGC